MSSEGHYQAAICRRGHVITALIEPAVGRSEPIPKSCSKCGAKVLISCPNCEHRLKGMSMGGYPLIGGPQWEPDEFCESCAQPLPWAKRESIALHIENLLDEQPELDEGNRRVLEERLQSLRDSPSDASVEKRQIEALKLFHGVAPKAWQIALPALQVLLTTEMKRALGLPPA